MLAIRSNISALHALNRLQRQQANVQAHSSHLSTGQRANGAAEDAVAIQLSSRAQNRLAGYASANFEIWDDGGRLLATGTQMMIIRKVPADDSRPAP